MHRLIALFLLVILVLPASQARADDPYEEISASALAISPSSFDSVRQGIEQLAVSGDPRAAVVIGALHDGTLYANDDHVLFIQQPDGKYVDAQTGAPAPDVIGRRRQDRARQQRGAQRHRRGARRPAAVRARRVDPVAGRRGGVHIA